MSLMVIYDFAERFGKGSQCQTLREIAWETLQSLHSLASLKSFCPGSAWPFLAWVPAQAFFYTKPKSAA
jgi:hypothetical protein